MTLYQIRDKIYYSFCILVTGINGVVVTWVVAIDPPGVRFPLNAVWFFIFVYFYYSLILSKELDPGHVSTGVGPGGGPELTYTEYGR